MALYDGTLRPWWGILASEAQPDIEYLIFRPDPDNRLPLKEGSEPVQPVCEIP